MHFLIFKLKRSSKQCQVYKLAKKKDMVLKKKVTTDTCDVDKKKAANKQENPYPKRLNSRLASPREETAKRRKKDHRLPEIRNPKSDSLRESSTHRAEKMEDGEAPEKVRRANEVRWKECAKMAKVERKLLKRLREDPRQRHFIPEPSLPGNLSKRTTLERCGECDQCKAIDCGTCGNCQGEGPRTMRAQS